MAFIFRLGAEVAEDGTADVEGAVPVQISNRRLAFEGVTTAVASRDGGGGVHALSDFSFVLDGAPGVVRLPVLVCQKMAAGGRGRG